jgi:3-oxoacyl-[acyl-carrier protein] reductase
MSDSLLRLGRNKTARSLANSMGLPLPATLRRDDGPWQERPLDGLSACVLRGPGAALDAVLAPTLAAAGADCCLVGDAVPAAYTRAGEAWGHPPRLLTIDQGEAHDLLVVDATGMAEVDDTRSLYTMLQPRVGLLRASGRVVVLSRPPEDAATAETQAVRRGIEGFVRSLAKELGRRGSTANQLIVPADADSSVAPALRWLLSSRSAYVSGQPWHLSGAVALPAHRWVRPLDGQLALVTGAAQGIGAATARVLAREGARVVLLDRPDESATTAALAAEIGGLALDLDLTDSDAPARVAAFAAEHGGLQVVVHNAGVTRDRTLGRMEPALWDLTLDVNLRAVLRLQAALDAQMKAGGRVVCLSSIAGLAGNVGQTNYATSKAAIVGFVAGAAPGLAARGIAINGIAPGYIETRLTAAIPAVTREAARRLCNLSQGGLPADVAEAVLFLSSPGAAALSGQVLRVCGGSLVGA